jgi:hypothetical protein
METPGTFKKSSKIPSHAKIIKFFKKMMETPSTPSNTSHHCLKNPQISPLIQINIHRIAPRKKRFSKKNIVSVLIVM